MEGRHIEINFIHIFMMLMVFQGSRTMHVANVCLKGYIEEDALTLTCRMDTLTFEVVIIGPNDKTFGKCLAPIRQYNDSDCSGNTKQDLTTNTTTLFLNETDTSMNGVWRCTHGTKTGEDWLNITIPQSCKDCLKPEDSNYKTWCIILAVAMGMIVIVVFIYYAHKNSYLSWCCNRIQDLLERYRQPSDEDLRTPLISGEHSHDNELQSKCKTCKNISSYAFCTDCSEFFCEICCKHHIELNQNHDVNEIVLVESNNVCGKCKICNRKNSVRACKKCKTALCNSCNCKQKHSETEANVAEFRNNPQRSTKKRNSETAIAGEPISLAYEIRIPKVDKRIRICGIAILHKRIVVVVDRNNKNIMAFDNVNKIDTYDLDDEPRGMTGVYDNKFAVTFPDVKEIRLFFIRDSKIRLENTFSVSLIGKPFNISYNSDHYAVEIGEEEDGMIFILDSEGKEINQIPNTGYGYFTGHTIRLCLDKCAECVYVSAMSKKEISSIKFDGSVNWHIDVPSPRGMLLIPGTPVSDMNLILASRRGNTIYQINRGNGSKTILKTDREISGPQYIVYEPIENLLCVQLDNCVLHIYNYIPVEVNIEIENNKNVAGLKRTMESQPLISGHRNSDYNTLINEQ